MEENELKPFDIDEALGEGPQYTQPQRQYVYTSMGTNLTSTWANGTVEEFTDKIAQAEFEILTAYSKKDILKKLNKFKKSHKVINISLSTDTKYSKTFDKEYTEFNVLVQYL